MEKEKEIERKLVQIDDEYQVARVKLSRHFDTVDDEKAQFYRYLDNVSSQLQAINHHLDESEVDIAQAYHLLEQAQDEAEQLVKKTNMQLEDTLDNIQYQYNRQVDLHEEELRVVKREAK